MAVWGGHDEVIKELLEGLETPERKAYLHMVDQYERTPLFIAAHKGHVDVIRVLKELGSDVNMPKTNGLTPVYTAAAYGHADVIKILAGLGAEVNTLDKKGKTPVNRAVDNRHTEVAKLLKIVNHLDNNISIDTIEDINRTNRDAIIEHYTKHKDEINSLMEKRKISLIALSLVNFDKPMDTILGEIKKRVLELKRG